jgi:hypothetical protein
MNVTKQYNQVYDLKGIHLFNLQDVYKNIKYKFTI